MYMTVDDIEITESEILDGLTEESGFFIPDSEEPEIENEIDEHWEV